MAGRASYILCIDVDVVISGSPLLGTFNVARSVTAVVLIIIRFAGLSELRRVGAGQT